MNAENFKQIFNETMPFMANYELTVTTGLENIAAEEVKDKLNLDATVEKGRIRVCYDGQVDQLLKLRSINNAFVTIFSHKQYNDSELPNQQNLEEFLFAVASKCEWKTGLQKWLQVSKFDASLDMILEKNSDNKQLQPSFRVSCNRFGDKHTFQSPQVCSTFGHVLDTNFGWPIKMKNYDLEVLINFYENDLNISFTLTKLSLDKRNIVDMGYTTLRGTTCYAMLRLARIQPGDIVIDPMAGSGAIPIECSLQCQAKEWQVVSLAGDLVPRQVTKCYNNVENLKKMPCNEGILSSDILTLNVRRLPFKCQSVDVFVSDLPFGKRVGNKGHNLALYASLLGEMARCSKVNVGRAVLLTQDKTAMKYGLSKNDQFWTIKQEQFVKVGNLPCIIFVLLRNSTLYTSHKGSETQQAKPSTGASSSGGSISGKLLSMISRFIDWS